MEHPFPKILFKIFIISLIIFIISTFLYWLGEEGFLPYWWEHEWIGAPGEPGYDIFEIGLFQGITGWVRALSFLFAVISFILWLINLGVNKLKSSRRKNNKI